MKAVIYQYWEGNMTPGNEAGVHMMREYAKKIGVEYVFEHNPTWPKDARIQRQGLGNYQPHYGAFKPLFDSAFDNYDYVLFCDTDVIPTDKCNSHIFGEFMQARIDDPGLELWISEEWMQPGIRIKHDIGGINNRNDEKWVKGVEDVFGVTMPRTAEHRLPKVFNSGVVMYSAYARQLAQEKFVDFKKYVDWIKMKGLPPFYSCDQPYLHLMLEYVYKNQWAIMPYKWNSQIHHTPGTRGQEPRPISDYRGKEAQFVHVQLNGADHYTLEETLRVVND